MSVPVLPDALLADFLADDVRLGDLTTHLLGIASQPALMTFAARQPLVLAGAEEAARIIEMTGATVELHQSSGARLAAGGPILTAVGSAGALHRSWKVAQTLLEIASGIATATRSIVDAAQALRPDIAVACTRKTVPGAKLLSIKAIMAGGATPHRLGLSETILVFEEHRCFLADRSPAQIVDRLRRAGPEKKIVIEVATAAAAVLWAKAGADVIQAEKFSPSDIAATAEAFRSADLSALLAAAGGVNAENAADYARAGADILVTSAPYAAKPRDVQVKLTPK
ncbi:MAG: ModD protein [Xanthobacteraceae bacterium]|jgi:molybdenum transport protein